MISIDQNNQADITGEGLLELKDRGYALCAVGQLLANIFRFPLTDEQISFFQEFSYDEDDFVLQNEACAESIRVIQDYFSQNDLDALKLNTKNDFHKLFVGPDKLRAVPWSSVYVDAQGIFGPTAQKVQTVFRDHGFEIPEGHREPSDHIAYELQFMVDLQREALDLWDAASVPEETKKMLKEVSEFKTQLMDIWVPQFIEKVKTGARVPVYQGVADLMSGYLELEQEYLDLSVFNSSNAMEEV